MEKWWMALWLVSIGLCKVNFTKAQYYFYNDKYYSSDLVIETGFSGGIMNSLTDLGGRKGRGKDFIKDLNWRVTRPDYSLYVIALYKDALGVRLEVTKGSICSYDSLLKKTDPDLVSRYGRNLSFKSNIIDLQLSAEIHPLFFKLYEENKSSYWSPYLIAGIGYFSFNPQASLNGHWHDLHPLRLEGQGFAEYQHKSYKLHQFNIPLGVGIKYEINSGFVARIEIVHRILFTDYLDDVSTYYIDPVLFGKYLSSTQVIIAQKLYSRMQELQPSYTINEGMDRGDASDNDAFFSIQLKIGWTMRKKIK